MKRLPKTFWAWLAGFFDGEGCIASSISPSPYIGLKIGQKDRRVLQYIKNNLKTGKIYDCYNKTWDSTTYIYHVTGKDNLLRVYKQMLPYAVYKKKPIELAIQFLKLVNPQKRWVSLHKEEKIKLIKKIRKLNQCAS